MTIRGFNETDVENGKLFENIVHMRIFPPTVLTFCLLVG